MNLKTGLHAPGFKRIQGNGRGILKARGFPGVLVVKNMPAKARDAGVLSLGWEDPLEEHRGFGSP